MTISRTKGVIIICVFRFTFPRVLFRPLFFVRTKVICFEIIFTENGKIRFLARTYVSLETSVCIQENLIADTELVRLT